MKDWLDDPEWQQLKRRVETDAVPRKKPSKKPQNIDSFSYKTSSKLKNIPRSTSTPKPAKEENKHNKHIQKYNKKVQLSLRITLSKPKLPSLTKRQARLVIGTFVGLVIIVSVLVAIAQKAKQNPGENDGGGTAEQVSQTPLFSTLLPKGKQEDGINGGVRYDPIKKVVNYRDNIGGVQVTISEQALPANFGSDPGTEVEKIAKNFSADKPIYAGEVEAFYGISEEGPQTTIFSKKNVLVFIYAPRELDREALKKYITDLE